METTRHDRLMAHEGYNYRLDSPGIASLYAKHLHDIGPLMRQWPDRKFQVSKLDSMETTKQAAQRIGIPLHTLYRRLQRLCENGKLVMTPDDYVCRCLYLSSQKWDAVCAMTPPPGRPRTGLSVPPTPTKDSR